MLMVGNILSVPTISILKDTRPFNQYGKYKHRHISMAEISEIPEDKFPDSIPPGQIANFHNMYCTVDDLATLHTFEAQFHDGLPCLDTLDENLESPDLFAVHNQWSMRTRRQPTGNMLLWLLCIFVLNNSAARSRKWHTHMFLATCCINGICMLLCFVKSIQKGVCGTAKATQIQLGNADPTDGCTGESVHSTDELEAMLEFQPI